MASEEKSEVASSGAIGSTSSGGSGNKLQLLLTIVNTLAIVGMAGVIVVSFQQDRKQPRIDDIAAQGAHSAGEKPKEGAGAHGEVAAGGHAQKSSVEFGKMVTLEQFTINLSTPGSSTPKFVRVNISLEVPNDDAETEINQKMPQVRNAVIDLFNSKRPSDLATPEGRDFLKEEIRNALNGFMVSGKVKGVFFTNFAVAG